MDGEEVSTAQTLPAGSAVRGETVSARVRLVDVEDVLPQDNVTWCLEVQASEEWNLSAGWIHDDDDNHRPDDTTTGITTYYAASQTHSNIIEPDGEGILWVLDQLDGLYGGG